jgi:hypothetical protein
LQAFGFAVRNDFTRRAFVIGSDEMLAAGWNERA